MEKLKYLIKLLRPSQWIKNFFVFGAMLFSNNFMNYKILKDNIITFIAFCFISSTVYILNDIIDIEKDRNHPKKCKRPIASGKVSIFNATILGILLLMLSLYISFSINKFLVIIILLYFLNNIVYSLKIKNIILLDVISISIGFILRVLSGGFATGVKVSDWIILCTFFLSLFLGLGKRRNELIVLGEDAQNHRKNLSQYNLEFLNKLISIVLTCTIIFYAIYSVLGAPANHFVWTNIAVIVGILRYYYLMYYKQEGGSPTELVLKDKQIMFSVVLWIFSCALILNI